MTKKQLQQLDKVYAVATDATAQQTHEAEAALNKLQTLCKTYKVSFDAYMQAKQENAAVTTIDDESTYTADFSNALAKAAHLKSRRAFIIDRLSSCMYDKHALAEEITLFFKQYSNVKQNLQAISGTCYDLQQNYEADIVVCDTTSRVLLKSYKQKSKRSSTTRSSSKYESVL